MIKLIAHAAPPLFETPGFKQFDLLLDGCSYFDMPRIFELGIKNKLVPAPQSDRYTNYSLPYPVSPDERSRDREPRGPHVSQAPVRRVSDEPAPDVLSEMVPTGDLLDTTPALPALTNGPVADEFAPVSQAPAPPSFAVASNQILSAYGPAPTTTTLPQLANESHTYYAPPPQQQYQQPHPQYQQPHPQYQHPQYQHPQQQYQPPQQTTYGRPEQSYQQPYVQTNYQPEQQYYQQDQYYYHPTAPAVSPDASMHSARSSDASNDLSDRSQSPIPLTMQPLSLQEIEAREQPPMSDMDRAVQSLVNFDLLDKKETPEQVKAKSKKLQSEPLRSKPKPPTTPEWHLGMKAKLADIQEHAPKKEPAKEIMRTHAFDPAAVHAGMMVVYASTMPLQQPMYMQQQQQQHYAQPMYAQQQQQQQQHYAKPPGMYFY